MHGNLFNDAHLFKPPVPLLSTYKCAVIRKVHTCTSGMFVDTIRLPVCPSPAEKNAVAFDILCIAKRYSLFFFLFLPLLFVSSICVSTPRVTNAVGYSQWMNSDSRSIDSPISRCLLTRISARDLSLLGPNDKIFSPLNDFSGNLIEDSREREGGKVAF